MMGSMSGVCLYGFGVIVSACVNNKVTDAVLFLGLAAMGGCVCFAFHFVSGSFATCGAASMVWGVREGFIWGVINGVISAGIMRHAFSSRGGKKREP